MKNWMTSAGGLTVGLPMIIEGISTKNWMLVLAGVGALLTGLAAKDNNVSGA